MRMVDLIAKKRDGYPLTAKEIQFIVNGCTTESIPDYQLSAWAMAVCLRGMEAKETAYLTRAMAASGDKLIWDMPGRVVVDKHSTGGVGDKTSLILAPLVAACGVPVAKMSGRGLGHTGGTIDKLLSIPGFEAVLSEDRFRRQVQEVGAAIVAQSDRLAPADKRLYSLRDVTATVESVPLIASSVMSKKIAAGAQGIVLDVKYGAGAFMSTQEQAKSLAEAMVAIGKNLGRETVAVLSAMDEPLGCAVGNRIEVLEAIDVLRGQGPADLREACLDLGAQMLRVGRGIDDTQRGRALLETTLASGAAWRKFEELVEAQSGDLTAFFAGRGIEKSRRPGSLLKQTYASPVTGRITWLDARQIGLAAMVLGAGREMRTSEIDPDAGILLHHKRGQTVAAGEPLLTMLSRQPKKIAEAQRILATAVKIES